MKWRREKKDRIRSVKFGWVMRLWRFVCVCMCVFFKSRTLLLQSRNFITRFDWLAISNIINLNVKWCSGYVAALCMPFGSNPSVFERSIQWTWGYTSFQWTIVIHLKWSRYLSTQFSVSLPHTRNHTNKTHQHTQTQRQIQAQAQTYNYNIIIVCWEVCTTSKYTPSIVYVSI